MTDIKALGQTAKASTSQLSLLSTKTKNQILNQMAEALEANTEKIIDLDKKRRGNLEVISREEGLTNEKGERILTIENDCSQ